jgi:hypothetical protein
LVDDSTEALYFSPYRDVGIIYAISLLLHFFRLGCAKKENLGFLLARMLMTWLSLNMYVIDFIVMPQGGDAGQLYKSVHSQVSCDVVT